MTWYCILVIAGNVAGLSLGFYEFGAAYPLTRFPGIGPRPTMAQFTAVMESPIQGAFILVASGTVAFSALILLTLAFRDLGKVDRKSFHTPSIFMVLMILGLAMLGVTAISLLGIVPELVANPLAAPGGPIPSSLAPLGPLLVWDLVIFASGGTICLAGAIGGLILGLWRLGARYDKTTIKAGAIFAAIPFLNFVAPILVLFGVHRAKGRLA